MAIRQHHLQISNLSCQRQDNILFKNLNFEAFSGQLVHILGKNGSGKSSLLKLIIGLLKPVAGQILWNNEDIHHFRSTFNQILTYIGHKPAIKTELTVMENIRTLLGYSDQEYVQSKALEVLDLLELSQYQAIQAGYLSQGQQRRIALARLWLEQTDLWILDEPYTALDKDGVKLINRAINQALESGVMVIFTSHQQTHDFGHTIIKVSLESGC